MNEPTEFIQKEQSPWDKVRQALQNSKYDFRTVHGISRETKLTVEDVKKTLDEHRNDVRLAYGTDKDGNVLYTLRSKPRSIQEIVSNVRVIVSSSASST